MESYETFISVGGDTINPNVREWYHKELGFIVLERLTMPHTEATDVYFLKQDNYILTPRTWIGETRMMEMIKDPVTVANMVAVALDKKKAAQHGRYTPRFND